MIEYIVGVEDKKLDILSGMCDEYLEKRYDRNGTSDLEWHERK